MKESWQVVLAGEGGQGLVLAGVILGEAAVAEGRYAAQTAAYGIASRGGLARSEVVISDTVIEYPGVDDPDIVLALSPEAMHRYFGNVKDGCLLIFDNSAIAGDYSGRSVVGLPFAEKAAVYKIEKGQDLPLNILCLGVVSGIAGVVELTSLTRIVLGRFQKGAGINMDALTAGYALGRARRRPPAPATGG
ncbi:MAG: 2-oxoacid:acceptor oxidoreductase family protein [Bacillota bacterium]|nr:2-oxoacid:acceptor oxidoreductase family protein [Bacillota bacterium]MDW7684784.1 2-oxoacid:acceptor oxidoreductase family protein [Bacillota bacterium]